MRKKAESNLLNMLLVLTAISVVSAGVLALADRATAEPILKSRQEKKSSAVKIVLPQFEELRNDTIAGLPCWMASDPEGKPVGVAVESFSDAGFSGHISIMVGFDSNGTITGYQILETHETPGLGAKADSWFQEDGKGCVIGKNPGTEPLKVAKDGGEVDAISGATITSRAFCEAINTAYKIFEK